MTEAVARASALSFSQPAAPWSNTGASCARARVVKISLKMVWPLPGGAAAPPGAAVTLRAGLLASVNVRQWRVRRKLDDAQVARILRLL